MVKIFIDPGHGGSDPGAVGNNIQEKNINLQIANEIRKILLQEYENVTIRMSRSNDATISLVERTNAANSWNADYYLSVHINAGGGTGFESYVYPSSGTQTIHLQSIIHDEVVKATGFANRGKKKANFHVLRETRMPALLTENGFIDTASDANKLKNSSFIEAIAKGHVNGIARAFSLKKKQIINPPASSGNSGSLYRVQIGAFQKKENADRLAAQAKAKGFDILVLKSGNLYKVQIGAFSIRGNAEKTALRARNAGFDTVIITSR